MEYLRFRVRKLVENIAIRGKNTSISVVIVPLSRVNKNSVAYIGWLNSNILFGKTYYSGNIGLPDTEYLRFCVRKLLENTAIPGRNKTLVFRW